MTFAFDCNWDLDKRECLPTVSAQRIGDGGYNVEIITYRGIPLRSGVLPGNPGWNTTWDGAARVLNTRFGISVRFAIIGQGRSFDVDSTLTQIGSLLWFISLVPVVIDILASYVLPKPVRDRFEEMTIQKFTVRAPR